MEPMFSDSNSCVFSVPQCCWYISFAEKKKKHVTKVEFTQKYFLTEIDEIQYVNCLVKRNRILETWINWVEIFWSYVIIWKQILEKHQCQSNSWFGQFNEIAS